MKKSAFSRWVLPALLILLVGGMGVQLTSCDNNPSGDDPWMGGENPGENPGGQIPGGGNPSNGGVADIKFDVSGATAILATEGTQGRAVNQDNNILFKVLADDSVVPIFDFSSISNSAPPKVKFIARSPVQGKKDLYICFVDNWEFWTEGYSVDGYLGEDGVWVNGYWVDGERVNIGSFIHVKEDGTIVSIVWNEDNSYSYVYTDQNNDAVAFDQYGNLYFTISDNNYGYYGSNSISAIYKYDPVATQRKLLTTRLTGTSYENVQLSADGIYIVVKGKRWDNNTGVDFLRLIPTANPDMITNIFYRTGGGSEIRSFALNPRTRDVYLSGNSIYNDGSGNYSGGFYKVSVRGTSQSDIVWTPLFTNTNSYYSKPQFTHSSSEWVNSYYDEDEVWHDGYTKYSYSWNPEFCDKDGDPDYGKMMEALRGYFMSEYIEFRHPDYDKNKLTNEAALKELNDKEELGSISAYYDSSNSYIENYASDYCYRTRTNTKATQDENFNFGFEYMDAIFIGSDDSVWGIPYSWNSKKVLTQLIDKNGKRDFYIPKSMENRILINAKPTESYLYFCADVSSSGIESGYQNIYRFNYNDPETVQNMFEGIRTRDKNYMEVFSYAISGSYLYFGGTQGVSILAGKINLTTGGYTELEFGQRITAMVSY